MPETRVADLVQELEGQLEGLRELLRTDLDFAVVEEAVRSSLGRVAGSVLAQVIEPLLSDEEFMRSLKGLGGRLGMRLKDVGRSACGWAMVKRFACARGILSRPKQSEGGGGAVRTGGGRTWAWRCWGL
jgi:hypothetical protein